MQDLDMILGRVRDAPVPPVLSTLDSAVMDALAAQPASHTAARPLGLAAVVALAIGMIGAIPEAKVEAATTAAPLGVASALAPSTLLDSKG